MFEGLCRTLASALGHATDSTSSLGVALAHIRRWKAFLSGRGGPRLSPEEVRGLFAELTFLLEMIDSGTSVPDAVGAWLGPERSHQDFICGNTAVEIKALSGSERSAVRISSEDQLESLNDSLFLRLYRLSSLPDANTACSLNSVVAMVENRLDDVDAVVAFDRKLAAQGYAPLPDYDEPRFVVSEIRTYLVEPAFPRLIRSQLPSGVAKVACRSHSVCGSMLRPDAFHLSTATTGQLGGAFDGLARCTKSDDTLMGSSDRPPNPLRQCSEIRSKFLSFKSVSVETI